MVPDGIEPFGIRSHLGSDGIRGIRSQMGSIPSEFDPIWNRTPRDSTLSGLESLIRAHVGSSPSGFDPRWDRISRDILGDSVLHGIEPRGIRSFRGSSPEGNLRAELFRASTQPPWFSASRVQGGDVCQRVGLDPCPPVQRKNGIQLVTLYHLLIGEYRLPRSMIFLLVCVCA